MVLGVRPLRWIGERSYGIYLWHWPIFMVTRPGLDTDITGWANTALRFGLTIIAAELSFRFVEEPIRHGSLGRWFAAMKQADKQDRRVMLGRTVATVGVVVLGVAVAGVGLASAQPPRLEAGLRFLVSSADEPRPPPRPFHRTRRRSRPRRHLR